MAAFLPELRHRPANSLREWNFNFDSRTNNIATSLMVQLIYVVVVGVDVRPIRGTRPAKIEVDEPDYGSIPIHPMTSSDRNRYIHGQ